MDEDDDDLDDDRAHDAKNCQRPVRRSTERERVNIQLTLLVLNAINYVIIQLGILLFGTERVKYSVQARARLEKSWCEGEALL